MITNEDIPQPDVVIVDPVSGYAINIPLGYQVPPGWVEQFPEQYSRILEMRKEQNVVIEDDLLPGKHVPDEEPPPRRRMAAPLPKSRHRGKAAKGVRK